MGVKKLLYQTVAKAFSWVYLVSRVESKMVQLADAFAKPMMCLLADLNQWFRQSGLDFVPEAVYNDVNVSHRNSLVLS